MSFEYRGKYYDNILSDGHSIKARNMLLSLAKKPLGGLWELGLHGIYPNDNSDYSYKTAKERYERFVSILELEVDYIRSTDCFKRLLESSYIADIKREFDDFLRDSTIYSPLRHSSNGGGVTEYSPNDKRLLDMVNMGKPFSAKDIQHVWMTSSGLFICVCDYHEGDGYGSTTVSFHIPNQEYRQMSREELSAASIIIADLYPDLFFLDIQFEPTTEKKLFSKEKKALDYRCNLQWGQMKPFPYRTPTPPATTKPKDLY